MKSVCVFISTSIPRNAQKCFDYLSYLTFFGIGISKGYYDAVEIAIPVEESTYSKLVKRGYLCTDGDICDIIFTYCVSKYTVAITYDKYGRNPFRARKRYEFKSFEDLLPDIGNEILELLSELAEPKL